MPRARDDSAAASAAALSASGSTAREIGAGLGRDERTVRRWLGDGNRRPGPRGRTDVTTAEIVRMRDREGMSWRRISREAGMSVTGVRKRYDRRPASPDLQGDTTMTEITLTLPPGIHAEVISNDGIAANGTVTEKAIVWADRTYLTCHGCGQETCQAVGGCPVTLGEFGQPQEFSQECADQGGTCGAWLTVSWTVAASTEEAAILAAALELAGLRREALDAERAKIRAWLLRELDSARRELSAPLEIDGETRSERESRVYTGTDADPGVYYDSLMDGGTLVSWDFDPASPEDAITVTEDDLTEGTRSA